MKRENAILYDLYINVYTYIIFLFKIIISSLFYIYEQLHMLLVLIIKKSQSICIRKVIRNADNIFNIYQTRNI